MEESNLRNQTKKILAKECIFQTNQGISYVILALTSKFFNKMKIKVKKCIIILKFITLAVVF